MSYIQHEATGNLGIHTMLFDRYPHTVESIIQPDGRIVIPSSKLPNLIVAVVLTMLAIQIPVACIRLDLGIWSLLGLLALPFPALCFLVSFESIVDPTAGTFTRLWGVGERKYVWESTDLASYDAVTFGWYMVSNKNGSYRVDCVGLRDQSTGTSRELAKVKDENDSRAYGEAIARVLNLPLQRLGSSESRSVDELDTKLADRVAEEELPTAPEGMRSELRHKGDQFVVEIAGPDPNGIRLRSVRRFGQICQIVGVGFLLFAAVGAKLPLLPAIFLFAFASLVGIGLHHFVITSTLREMEQQAARLSFAADRLIIWERDVRRTETTTEIPYDELEEFYHDAKGPAAEIPEWLVAFTSSSTRLVASSDQATTEFAAWLPRPEKEYLVALVRQLLVRMNLNAQPSTTEPTVQATAEFELAT